MWYEILLPSGIIMACLAAPWYTSYYTNKLILGKSCRRPRLDWHDKFAFDRDEQLTGFSHDTLGLDAIPDEPLRRGDLPSASQP
ncbi:hypothetical protein BV898_04853 [Hypsibius exemplaris]|uniref:Uncharacterized protein n=1 Tax=Hypsibius exemplaris TaxID=2072580 RepID=A0A1W0X0T0_HYPEX|nr:hypothetical protein BV898_04853 [Hypsibius exemplaris]